MEAYLWHEDLWDCIEGKEKDDTKSRRHAKIILVVDPLNFMHIRDASNATLRKMRPINVIIFV